MSSTKNKQAASNQSNIADSSSFFNEDDVPRMVIDENQTIIFCNQALYKISNIVEGSSLDHVFKLQGKTLAEGTNTLTLKKDNRILPFHIDRIDTNNGGYFMVASTEEVSLSEDSDQTPFIDLSFDACCITDNEGQFITINDNFTNLFGFDITALEGKNLTDIIHHEDIKKFEGNIALLHQNTHEQYLTIETYCYDSEGKTRWVEWNHKYVDGKLYSTGRDLTPLKSYRESLQRQEKKLKEAEAIGHIGQWEWQVGGENIEFSDQLYAIFGVEPDEFNPTLNNITKMIDRRDSGRMMQVFQRAVIEQNDYDMDFRLTRPDGSVRYIRCEGRCEIDKHDEVIALYGIMQDTTLATQRELDLVDAKDCVERAYAAKTQFLANMSHELRTPLNAIIGFSEMIERQLLGPIGTEKYLEYISGIRESGEHLLDLISDILDMSKIEAGKYELNIEKFNIAKILRMAAHMMEGRALDAEIKINIDIEDEDLIIAADRRALLQMVLNLLSNAVKFSHNKGHIDLKMIKKTEHVTIIVADEGIGIPANKLANITMPFEQAESDYTREYEGSGLGLAITKELAEIHGGGLFIESKVDIGTTVTIRVPHEAKRCR